MRYLCLGVLLLTSQAFAELNVSVKKAATKVELVTTTTVVESSQIQTVDGDKIGEPVSIKKQSSVVSGSSEKPAAILSIKADRPISELLLRLKCKTCKPVSKGDGIYTITEPGKHEISITAYGQNPLFIEDEDITIEISGTPTPTPKPDDPTPTPKPDDPTPGAAPIDGIGLRVLFVYESSERVTPSQEEIMDGAEMRAFLTANCAKGPDGRQAEWRKLDKETKFIDPTSIWKKALERPRKSIPWMMISNGVTGYEGPLPGSVAEAIALIKKYQTTSIATPVSLGKVVMHTTNPCINCDLFKKNEAPLLAGYAKFEINDKPNPSIKVFPTFYIYGNKGTVRLEGGTADTIIKILKELE